MLSKEEYKRNLIRMFDSIRDENKGDEICTGIRCIDCPFDGKVCNKGAPNFNEFEVINAFEAIETVENWVKEHPIKTNADKFKETFGFQAPMNRCVQSNVFCAECEYYDDERSDCRADERFWNTEYKEPTKEVEEYVIEKSKIDKAITQLEEEKEFAYADFEEYNEEVLSYDDTDVCERDSCYIGLARAIEILKRI